MVLVSCEKLTCGAEAFLGKQMFFFTTIFESNSIIDINLQLLQVVFILMEKKRGIQSSGVIFMFWLLLVICGIPEYRTYFLNILSEVSMCNLCIILID